MFASTSTAAVHDTGGDRGHGISQSLVVRAATRDDIVAFYGEAPRGTMRATVALIDGEVVGVIGVVREQRWGKYFSDFSEKLQPHLKSITIMRAIKQSLRFCDEYRGPVLSVALNAESCRLMNRLGFTHLEGGWYGWLG